MLASLQIFPVAAKEFGCLGFRKPDLNSIAFALKKRLLHLLQLLFG
jgi:hypothetical protein